jgi:hypothetical protein
VVETIKRFWFGIAKVGS